MKKRIWILSIAIILLSVIVYGFASTKVYYSSTVSDAKNYLQVYMNEFDSSAYSLDESGAKAFSDKLNDSRGVRVTFLDKDGNLIADSATKNAETNHSDRDEIIQAKDSKSSGYAVRKSATLGKDMIYYCKYFGAETETDTADDYMVRIAVETDNGWSIFIKTIPTVAPFLLILICLCVLVGIFITDYILAPVKKLAESVNDSDNLTTKFDELQPIADILNERGRNIKRQMEEIKAEKELVEKARASKDEFISNVTHEMNTPLTSIHGYAELLKAGVITKEQQDNAYSTILTQSERLTNLIACIINYSEIDSEDLPLYEVDFSKLAKETITAVKPEADKRGIEIIENIDENVVLNSRHEYLSEIVGNLVRNAIKYNKENGKIFITLTREKFVVEDTGIGIAKENMDKVFSRFFTVDKSHNGKNGGFGLGLAVVKKICQKNGWKISVDSVINEGSRFTVNF